MARVINRHELQRLVQDDAAQLIEVLPREEYEAAHIVRAINIPLKQLNRTSAEQLDPHRPVIVYCHDFT